MDVDTSYLALNFQLVGKPIARAGEKRIQQLSRTRSRGLAKRRQQIIRIKIDKVIFHAAYNALFPVGA